MASTHKFSNTGLNKWILSDKPVMEDFNSDNQIIDSLAGHLDKTPYIGADGFWYIWDTTVSAYQKTMTKATGETGAQGPQGIQGIQGDKGDKGARGNDGRGFEIKGIFATEQALKTTHPTGNPGEAYAVGSASDNTIFIWSVDLSAWQNIGKHLGPQGVQGEQGAQGPQGVQGPVGAKGEKGDSGAIADAQGNALNSIRFDGKTADEFASISQTRSALLSASAWIGSSAPYEQVLSVLGVTEQSVQEILPALSATEQQIEMLQSANLQDGGQAKDQITLKAFGDKPPVDLPIRIILRGDI